MAFYEIPTEENNAAYSFQVDLEQKTYGFAFHFNIRINRWFFDISSRDGTTLLQGLPVFVGNFPMDRFSTPGLPPGRIAFIDTSGQNLDPSEADMGSRVIMIYADSTEVF